MAEIAVLQVCLSELDDVVIMDGCWLRKCHGGASGIFGYVCTSQSGEELAQFVSIVINRTTFVLGLQVDFVELISCFRNN